MILTEVKIDMDNSNALVTIAYISQSKGQPYYVFCEYIKYCLTKYHSRTILLGELRKELGSEFGISFPQNVLTRCLSLLRHENFLSVENHRIHRHKEFDCAAFDEKRNYFRQSEDYVIQQLVLHVSKLGKSWDEAYAKKMLSNFMRMNGNAFEIFNFESEDTPNEDAQEGNDTSSQGIQDDAPEKPVFSDQWYVGNFVHHALMDNNSCSQYLKDISKGLIILIGAYQLPSDENEHYDLNISGTEFYFDTKLLLRLMGCAWSEAVVAAKELVELIQKGGGRIYYFPHTLKEITRALKHAEEYAKNHETAPDKEMSYYLQHGNVSAATLHAKWLSVQQELQSHGILQHPMSEWDENDRLKFGIDSNDLYIFIRRKQPNWDSDTIDNDVASIREVHMLRKGNYQDYYGMSNRLPVFVTTNTRLTKLVLKYGQKRKNDKHIQDWSINRLPLITDVRLTCRLWNPSQSSQDYPLLQLAANAMAAQQPTPEYFSKLKQTVKSFAEKVPAYAAIPLADYCDDALTEQIVAKTGGEIDNLSVEVLATTLEEYLEMKSSDEQEKRHEAEQAQQRAEDSLQQQTQKIINHSVETHKNKIGWWRIPIFCANHWTWTITVVLAVLSSAISFASQQWYPMLVVAISLILALLEKLLDRSKVRTRLLKKLIPCAQRSYENKIKMKLNSVEREYEETIISDCIAETKSFHYPDNE